MLGGEPLPVDSWSPVLRGPSPVPPLLPTPRPRAIRQTRFPNCHRHCRPHACPALSPRRSIDVSKKMLRTERLLALSHMMPVTSRPGALSMPTALPSAAPSFPPLCLLTPAQLCLCLFSAPAPPVPFHPLSDLLSMRPEVHSSPSFRIHQPPLEHVCVFSPPNPRPPSEGPPKPTKPAGLWSWAQAREGPHRALIPQPGLRCT